MPLQVAKLFSATVATRIDLVIDGKDEFVVVTWAPARYTGEMEDLAEILTNQEEADVTAIAAARELGNEEEATKIVARVNRRNVRHVRRLLSELLVTWDVMEEKAVHPTDEASLKKLPDPFLMQVFLGITDENKPDPQKPPDSSGTTGPAVSSAKSRRGTRSSGARTTSGSPRGT